MIQHKNICTNMWVWHFSKYQNKERCRIELQIKQRAWERDRERERSQDRRGEKGFWRRTRRWTKIQLEPTQYEKPMRAAENTSLLWPLALKVVPTQPGDRYITGSLLARLRYLGPERREEEDPRDVGRVKLVKLVKHHYSLQAPGSSRQ